MDTHGRGFIHGKVDVYLSTQPVYLFFNFRGETGSLDLEFSWSYSILTLILRFNCNEHWYSFIELTVCRQHW